MQTVVELSTFIRASQREGLSEAERQAVVDLIASDPETGDVMEGTGGCRKARIAGRGKGRSGGYRLITFFSGPLIPAFLITIYGKDRKDNLTKSERNALAALTAELIEAYSRRSAPLGRVR